MQFINLYNLFILLFFLAQKAISLSVGDYVDFGDNQMPAYGTVIQIKNDNLVTIRPHRFEGDFVIEEQKIKVVKNAQEIQSIKPTPSQYSINLMWINQNNTSKSRHIFPNDEALHKVLGNATSWAQKNPGAQVIVWYDGLMLSETQKIPELEGVTFKDIRNENFSEVINNNDVFSEKTPVFFRVDLLRAIIAYNLLKNNDKPYFFVYADIDVETMDKDNLFDASTIMDLYTYGIVMARGGVNGLENSFQIWSNTQEKLLDAAKYAIIDRSIKQKKYIDKENSLKLDNKDIPQRVYANYFFMFPYYYVLQKWCDTDNIKTIIDSPRILVEPTCDNPNKNHLYIKRFSLNNKKDVYFPSKIINAPHSQFGGTPTKFNPDKINYLNYQDKIKELATQADNKNYSSTLMKDLQDNLKNIIKQKNLEEDTLKEILKIFTTNENLQKVFFKKIENIDNIIINLDIINTIYDLNLHNNNEFISNLQNVLCKKDKDYNTFLHRIAMKTGIAKGQIASIKEKIEFIFKNNRQAIKDIINDENDNNEKALNLAKFPHIKQLIIDLSE